jgi:Isopropylmalate/homocitrate/citramalate synthases
MGNVKILDCTLRDGGYVNDFKFGISTIRNIIHKLSEASIDIIECGFLDSTANDNNCTIFSNIDCLKKVISRKKSHIIYVVMIQYGKISNEEISVCDRQTVDGIRLTFHEHEIEGALFLGKQLQKKGYKIFMQPVGTMSYSDQTILKLISEINEMKPYAFYMVDTLGTMYKKDLLRLFFLIDHNLNPKIAIGFHSHNNLQLAFSNAMELLQMNTQRQIIIDSSVYGMGRGAGNLCTELITQYVNDNICFKYNNLAILEVIDQYIKPLKRKYVWGYDVAYYIASINGCHPNYSRFLLSLQTLHVQDIHTILNSMRADKKVLYDKEYIEKRYVEFMSHQVDDKTVIEKYSRLIKNKVILILAPGKSISQKINRISTLVGQNNYFVISVNFIPKKIPVHAVFVSNRKRFEELEQLILSIDDGLKAVITSNVCTKESERISVINYVEYLNEEQIIVDNAGLMCINFVRKLGASNILLAGFDGFSAQCSDNYYEEKMVFDVDEERLQNMNEAFSRKILQIRRGTEIKFLTESIYDNGGENA